MPETAGSAANRNAALSVAVIGAGLAGTACARALTRAGARVVLYDKGRGPGGRLSTRRADTPMGEIAFDHGAQYLTARGDSFAAALEAAREAGAAAPWEARLVSLPREGAATPLKAETRWVGTPGMNAIVRALQDGLDVRYGRRAERLSRDGGGWRVAFEDGAGEGPFDAVALTLPPVQLAAFLDASDGDHAALAAEAAAARLAPAWTAMLAFEAGFDPGFDGAEIEGGPLAWAARMASRPGRPEAEAWVVHAAPDWTRAHLEDDREAVAAALAGAVAARFGAPAPVHAAAHRWRYALVEAAPGAPVGRGEAGVVAGGDWRLGPRGELAWDSGEAMAAALLD